MSSPMAVPIRTMHRVVGAATIAAFIVTGIYLKLRGPELFESKAGVMLLFLGILCHVPARK